ncbi:unnamed protein product [Adineta steineri]|uniref:Uncharacterized protein n=1 Tax=Adineta steineri TaxID=433720 RepID=A0A813Y6U2_9BILA|nr:unnamed protein product [Adineta steineri]
MIDDMVTKATTVANYNRRLSMLTIFLASVAFLIVTTAIAAFIYVSRKEKILRKFHLISVMIIIIIELAFLIAIFICCITQIRSTLGSILAIFLILISLFALMILIYFLLEDVIKDRIGPYPNNLNPYRSYEVHETKSESPIPVCADEKATTIADGNEIKSFPRLPTPPTPIITPQPPSEKILTPSLSQDIFLFPQESPFIVDFDKVRRGKFYFPNIRLDSKSNDLYVSIDLLAAIEERTIPALEEAIQQVKDHNYLHRLKYECERALELLNRLMKIEHMKIRVLRLNQSTIAELHSYTKPPDEVYTVMRATFLLLGHTDKEIQDWTQIQNLLGRLGKDSVRRRCYELSPLNILVDKAHEAKDILRNYDLIRVSEISIGLAAFYSWAVTMIEEREKLLESQRKIEC